MHLKTERGCILGVTAQNSELLDLLSPATFVKSVEDRELITADTTNGISRNKRGLVEHVPKKIYLIGALSFRMIVNFYSAVFSAIGNTGYGIVNFYREVFWIIFGAYF